MQEKIDTTGISHVWQAVSPCLGLLARRCWNDVNTHASRTQLISTVFVISLCNSVWNCCEATSVFGARGRWSSTKRRYRLRCQNPAWIEEPQQCEFEMSARKCPHRSAMKCVKICEKHLKHRCRADVSHNTSSSSDMSSCLSSIHMLMLNQDAQSGSLSS